MTTVPQNTPASPDRSPLLWELAMAAALFAAALVVYWPALNGTLLWDDAAHVTRAELQSLHGLWRIWFDLGAAQQYYPLLHSAFWFEHRIWGDHVLGYHLINVLLHVCSALMLRAIVRRLGLPGASLAAWLFALHPMQVESVAWITEQKNTLSTAFYLSSALLYLRFDRTRRSSDYVAAIGLFICALASKTTTATLPAALLVVFWWLRGRLAWRNDVAPLAPWFALSAGAAVLTSWVERTYIGAAGAEFTLNLVERALLAGRVIWFYAATFVWPVHLVFNYPRWDVDAAVWWQYIFPAGMLAVLMLAWRRRARSRGALAALLLFVGALTPALGFVNVYPFVYSYVADHFAYLATLVAAVVAAGAISRGAARIVGRQRAGDRAVIGWQRAAAAVLPAVAIVALLGWKTSEESAIYRNVETLYRTTIARNPSSWMANENLGVLLASVPGRLPEAAEAFAESVRIRPDRIEARRNLALALWNLGRKDAAIAEYERIVAMPGARGRDHVSLGRLLRRVPGREREALRHLRRALDVNPNLADAHLALGNALAAAGQPGAEREYQAAVKLSPDLAEAYLNLGSLLSQQPERRQEARMQYRASLRIRPNYAEAHYNLGTALLDVPGRNLDAVSHLTAAVRLEPGNARAHVNLALALSEQPDRTEDAIEHLETAIRLEPDLEQPRLLLQLLRSGRRP
jgi:tetratricopeptide (TPR) repeat protein